MRYLVYSLTGCIAIGIAACTSATAPHVTPGIEVTAGAGQSDTIDATLPQPLVIEVHAPSGASGGFQPIVFQGLSPRPGILSNAFVQGPHNSQGPTSYEQDTTDIGGHLSVRVTLGFVGGPARLVVSAPMLNLVDTVTFTVLPGAAVMLVVNPDTVVYLGASFHLDAVNEDGPGNPRPQDSVALKVLSGPLTLSGHLATPTAYGRAFVRASSQLAEGLQAVDTLIVTIVPQGTLMAGLAFGSGIATFDLDGSAFRVLTNVDVASVRWAPSAARAVFGEANDNGNYGGPIGLVDIAGNVRMLDSAPSGSLDVSPTFSRDGAWIYFARATASDTIWRLHADGTGIAAVHAQTAGSYFWPSPSPDGSELAVVDLDSNLLEVLNVSSGAITNLDIQAQAPQWSPDSDLIAYLAASSPPGPIAVVHADGTGARVVAAGPYAANFDWSPDGKWLVAWDAGTQRLEVVSADSGLVLPLDYASEALSPTILPSVSPSWQPTSPSGTAAHIRTWPVRSMPTRIPRR